MFEFVCVKDEGWTMRDQDTIVTFILEVVNFREEQECGCLWIRYRAGQGAV